MSSVEVKDQSCTRLEEGSIDDTEKPFQQETTIEASEQQNEIRTPPSEDYRTTMHVGLTFSAEEGSILEPCKHKQSPFSIQGIGYSPGHAPLTQSDAISQRNRFDLPCIEGIGSSRQSSLTDEDLTGGDRLDLLNVSDLATLLDHARPTERNTKVIFNEKVSLEETEIEVTKSTKDRQVLQKDKKIEAEITKQAKPTDGGVEFYKRQPTENTNTKKPFTERYFTADGARKVSLDTQDAETFLGTKALLAQQDAPADARFKKPHSQPTASAAEKKKPFTQQAPSVVSGVKKKHPQHASSFHDETKKLNFGVPQSQHSPPIPKYKVPFSQQDATADAIKKPLSQLTASAAEKKKPFTQQPPKVVSGAKKKRLQQSSSFYDEMRQLNFGAPLSPPKFAKKKVSFAQQHAPTDVGFKKLLSRLTTSAAEKMKKSLTQQAPPVVSEVKKEHPKESPSFHDEMENNYRAPLTQLTSSTFAKYEAPLPQQASAAAAGLQAPFTRQPQSDNIEIKTRFPQQFPPFLAGLQDPTQQSASSLAELEDTIQQPPLFHDEFQNPTQQSPPLLAEFQDPTQQSPPFLAEFQDPTQRSPSYVSRINPFYHQAAEGMKTRRTQHSPSVAVTRPNEQASISQENRFDLNVEELPEINVRNINRGIRGRRFQKLFPQTRRPPYRSLTERMYMEAFMEVVSVDKDKDKKKKKKKKGFRYACDNVSSESSSSSSHEASKSPPKSDHSSPELQFHLEL